ncbi:MAG: HIT domain-containing protein [Nanoarchaeota archaeon]|nr:HIT domain-containing protein [Nanoarchaeota archaeon]
MPEITEEQLKNMTPEQIAEMQKQNCIFCHIVSGKVASKKVYEDDKVTVILDINPANPGHSVIIPKEHYAIMPQIPEDILGHIFMVAKGISHACLKAFKAQGTNIFIANGVVAGQRAQHFMVHVIPRKENDGIKIFQIPHKDVSEDQLAKLSSILKAKVNQMMGIKEEVLDLDNIKKPEIKKEEEPTEAPEEGKEEPQEENKEEDVKTLLGGKEEPEEEKVPETEKEEEIDIDKIAELFK